MNSDIYPPNTLIVDRRPTSYDVKPKLWSFWIFKNIDVNEVWQRIPNKWVRLSYIDIVEIEDDSR